METRAQLKYLRMSPQKVRLVVDMVRGRTLSEALSILRFVPNRPARHLVKLLNSAAANAQTNHSMDRETLRVSKAYVDQGPSLKRYQPVSRGLAHPILKRTCHITVYVKEDEELAAQKAAERAKKAGRRGARGAGAGRARPAARRAPKRAEEAAVEAKPAKRGGRKPPEKKIAPKPEAKAKAVRKGSARKGQGT
jgi:large subunit ribosomal protein L22